jgi:hypothetical protein
MSNLDNGEINIKQGFFLPMSEPTNMTRLSFLVRSME